MNFLNFYSISERLAIRREGDSYYDIDLELQYVHLC